MRVTCVQTALRVDDPTAGLEEAIVAARAARGADLVVLPELVTSGYVLADRAEASARAETSDGPALDRLRELSADLDAVVVAGWCEVAGDALHNSAVVLDRGRLLAATRKAHLWGSEPDLFVAADEGPLVVDTSAGRLGVMVCYDAEFPEWVRRAAERGAELVAVPVNWPIDDTTRERPVELTKICGSAATYRVAVAVADCCGTDRDVAWIGGSSVINSYGEVLASAVADGWPGGPALVTADVDLSVTTDRSVGPRNHLLDDRRPELY